MRLDALFIHAARKDHISPFQSVYKGVKLFSGDVTFLLADSGHIAGVVAAHDAALRLLPKGHQITGQLTMMLVMVAYTFTGLYLLFGG